MISGNEAIGNSAAAAEGGGIFSALSGTVLVEDSQVTGNWAAGGAGPVTTAGGAVRVAACFWITLAPPRTSS